MPRQPRFIPDDVTVFELTVRTVKGLCAFIPTPEIRCEWAGILAVARMQWPAVQVHQACLLSNHLHALSSVRGPNAVNIRGRWASFVLAGTARLAQRQFGLDGRIWDGPYAAIAILDEASIRARTRYIMAQAVQARLVAQPNQWLGLNTVDALCRGVPIEGYYTTAQSRRTARRRGVSYAETATKHRFEPDPLPGHTNWTKAQRQAWYQAIETEIIEEAADAIAHGVYTLPTPSQILAVPPTTTIKLERTPVPKAHVSPASRSIRAAWIAAKRHFVDLWREALARWVDGDPPRFPRGGWVPFLSCRRHLQMGLTVPG